MTERDSEFFEELEKVLDAHFEKVEEEGPEKMAMRRGAGLVLFAEANRIHLQRLVEEKAKSYSEGYKDRAAEEKPENTPLETPNEAW